MISIMTPLRPLHKKIQVRLPRGGNNCDFCGSLFIAKMFPGKNFQWKGQDVFRSHDGGRWAACHRCGSLIESGSWDTLTARVMRAIKNRAGLSAKDLRALRKEVNHLHAEVRAHMKTNGALVVLQPHYIRLNIAGLERN
jgi:hypothetical protein